MGDTSTAAASIASPVKRAMDITAAVLLLLVLSPLLVMVALLIKARMGGPVLFRQPRPGYGERPFGMIKFRTMREPRPNEVRELSDGNRLTPLGRFLRKSSIDELPELLNVLRGEMSLVGPRPLLMQYLPFFTDRERLRFAARPGITGWAQVRGRNEMPWDERLEADAYYVEHWSLWLDLRILALTFRAVFSGGGIVVDARQRMPNLDEARALPSAIPSSHH
ncbi:MAG: sugar transferase [Gemmatimonadaceae bacterium]